MHVAIQENLGLLESCEALLAAIPAAEYTRATGVCFDGAIGVHVRHLLDHYVGFLGALENGRRVDYEARQRDARIEREPEFARALLRDVATRLAGMDAAILDSRMHARIEVDSEPAVWADSSPARELGFLVSHTVHHCALIGVICRANGVPVPHDFGVAPSTLRHRAAGADRCAR
jgi:uncharacterized damage-inducible protein DinB